MKDVTLDLVDKLLKMRKNGELFLRDDQAYALSCILDTRDIYLANQQLDNTAKNADDSE